MSSMQAPAKPGTVSRALARDRLGVPAVLFFVLAGVAPLTVAAGVIPTAYATTGLTGIPAAFIIVAVILAVFATGYVTMARHITNAGAFIARGLGRIPGIAAAQVALLAYTFLQAGLYGALGPAAQSEAARLHLHAPWWAWALIAWFLVTALGMARVDITGRVLGVLLVVLAVLHYGTLLGVAPGSPAAWILPASYAAAAAAGLCWGAVLRARRPQVYATIGLGTNAITGQTTPTAPREAQ